MFQVHLRAHTNHSKTKLMIIIGKAFSLGTFQTDLLVESTYNSVTFYILLRNTYIKGLPGIFLSFEEF